MSLNKTTCHKQNSGLFRQGQRSILKQIRFRAITVLFMVGFEYEEHPLVQSISLFILINSEPSSFKNLNHNQICSWK